MHVPLRRLTRVQSAERVLVEAAWVCALDCACAGASSGGGMGMAGWGDWPSAKACRVLRWVAGADQGHGVGWTARPLQNERNLHYIADPGYRSYGHSLALTIKLEQELLFLPFSICT